MSSAIAAFRQAGGCMAAMRARRLCAAISRDASRGRPSASAMGEEIGFDMVDGRPHLRWQLHRIVCEAA